MHSDLPSKLQRPSAQACFEQEAVRKREALPVSPEERLLLSLLRYIGAAYETEDAACWEAAHRCAETARGVLEGALLVARATVTIRLIRAEHPGFDLLPPGSRWLSQDEEALMCFIRCAGKRQSTLSWRGIIDDPGDLSVLTDVASAMWERCRPETTTLRS